MDEITACLKSISSSLSSNFSFGSSKLSKKLADFQALLKKTTNLTQDDFEKIFVGDESSKLKGLFHVCGGQSAMSGSLKKSARKAMELLLELVNERKEALTALNLLESDELALMKLHLHLARDDPAPFQVAQIIKESRPFLSVESYISNRFAQNKFKAYMEAEQKKGEKKGIKAKGKEKAAKVWKDEENEDEIKQLMVQGQIVATIQRKEVVQMSKVNDLKRDRTLEYFRQHFFDPLATNLGESFSIRRVTERVRKLGRSSLASSGYRKCPPELKDSIQYLHIESPDFDPFYLMETLHSNDTLEQLHAGFQNLKAQRPEEDRPEKGNLIDLYFVYCEEMFQAERFVTAFVQDCVIKKDKISVDVEVTRLLVELQRDFLKCTESQIGEKKLVVSYKMLASFLNSYERLLRFPDVLSLHLLRGELKQFYAEWLKVYPQLKTLSKYSSPTFKNLSNNALNLFFRWKAALVDEIQGSLLFLKKTAKVNEQAQKMPEFFDESGVFSLFVEVCEPDDIQNLLNGAKIALKSIMSDALADFTKTVKMSTKSVRLRFKDSLIGEMNKVKAKKNRLDLLSNDCDNLRAFIIGRQSSSAKPSQTRSLLDQIKHAETLVTQQYLPAFLQTLRLLDSLRSKHSSSMEAEILPASELFYSDSLQNIAEAVKSLSELVFGVIGDGPAKGTGAKNAEALRKMSNIFESIVRSLSECARHTAAFDSSILENGLRSIMEEVKEIEQHLFFQVELPEAVNTLESKQKTSHGKKEEICTDFMGRSYTVKSFSLSLCLFTNAQKFIEKDIGRVIDGSFFTELAHDYFKSCLEKACEAITNQKDTEEPTTDDLVFRYIGIGYILKSVAFRGPPGFELNKDYGLEDLSTRIRKRLQKKIKESINLPYSGMVDDPAPAFEETLLDKRDIRVLRSHIINVVDLLEEAKSGVILMKNEAEEKIWQPLLRKTLIYIERSMEEREENEINRTESGFLVGLVGVVGFEGEINEKLKEAAAEDQAKKLLRVWRYKLTTTHSVLFGK